MRLETRITKLFKHEEDLYELTDKRHTNISIPIQLRPWNYLFTVCKRRRTVSKPQPSNLSTVRPSHPKTYSIVRPNLGDEILLRGVDL